MSLVDKLVKKHWKS